MALENQYYLDGIDLWTTFGITIRKGGLNDFLRLPKRKDSINHDWLDEDGLDIDLTRNFYAPKDITLPCFIVADTEDLFWQQYNNFLNVLKRPGTRRFSVSVFGYDYYVYYRECVLYEKLTPFKQTGKLFCQFTLVVVEVKPGFGNKSTFLIDETNRFLIT